VVEEAIQHEGKARIGKLWQNLSYLGDMAVIAPMIGLLGTVLGMIQAVGAVYLPDLATMLPFALMVAILIWKPAGLAGSRT